jgi:Transposase DDE domain
MEDELWDRLYQVVTAVASRWPRRRRVRFSDAWVLLVYLWSVLHDRPQGWACQARHWPGSALRDRPLPSASRLSERLRQPSLRLLFEAVMTEARVHLPTHLVKCIDAKPLPVGGYSKDRDAKWGQAANTKAKGYKLFAIYQGAAVDGWRIGPMNASELTVAQQLVAEAARYGGGYLLGDGLYDSNPLHHVASQHELQLVAPRKKPGTALGHRPHDPSRLRSIELLEGGGAFGPALFACRLGIEQRLAQAGNLGCGLGPLPNWVRRPHRVALWVAAKLLIVTCWNHQKYALTA